MRTIAQWLASLGLSEYAGRFAEHRIDLSILRDLTDQDLEKIGVVLGDRRRILRAIAELAETISATSQLAAVPESKPRDEAERRQVTVMFSDLVGSTALATRMDPEDLREIISAFQKGVAETVNHFGGFVAQYMGDGVLAYFGYPQAQEDDAERAVRAGLALIVAVAGLETGASLQTRVGIATGLVVVGDLIGSWETQERRIVGETPNLAARLQEIAKPNMVAIADSTRRLLGNLFEIEDLGARHLKGFPGPVRTWAVLRPSSVESHFEALHTPGLAALVGREEESELLLRRWSKAKAGEGQVALLSGEAGIGKSRLTVALLESLADEPHMRLRYFCSPQRANSPLYPIIGQVERAAGLERDDTPQARLDKLDAMLAKTPTSMQDVALLAEMLSLPNDGRYPALELNPQQRRERTLDALNLQMEALSRSSPVLVIFEDVQWIDPTSLEALGRAVDRIRALRVLLIVTYRPEFEPPWIGRPHVTVLTISRLAQRHVDAMIDQVVGDKPLPVSIRRDIIERTDGIPLFVEEMTKAVLETDSEDEARRTAALIPSLALTAVPASLHASLMARLDRLGRAKELAQIGAAIGREFSHALLAAVVCKPEADLGSALDRLIQAGLLYRQGAPPHATYLFKHALIQDAAYGTLLREPRRALHARIAETLESQFAEITENQPELLAGHCTQAGQIEKAARLWGKAGQRSAHRSALVEAIKQITLALDHIATLPATPALRREEIELQVALITPLLHVSGYAASNTKAAVERARLLIKQAEALGEPPEDPLLLSVLYFLWVGEVVAFNGDAVRELAVQFLALAEKHAATTWIMIGHRLTGLSLLHTGDIVEGRAHLDRAIELYDPAEHRHLAAGFGHDVGVAILSWKSLALWLLGYPEAALAEADLALKEAREIGQAATLMYALASMTYVVCGNYAKANAIVDELVALTDQTGSLFWGAWGMMQRGCVLTLTGKASDAVQTITSGITAWRSTGSTMLMPSYLSYLAGAHAELGQFDDATRCIREAMTAVKATKERWYEAEVNRIAGEIALLPPEQDMAKAEAYFEHALAVARQQQAKSWELRAAISMAQLWRVQGKRLQARDLLASVYGWFSEGFDTIDLEQAKALLDELAQ
jgi:class 3 adenylate cyclase/predicted ATPase